MKGSNNHVLGALAITLICLCVAACGGGSKGTGVASRTATTIPLAQGGIAGDYDPDDERAHSAINDGDNDDHIPKDRDNDSDNSTHSYYDRDDDSVRHFGHPANRADRHGITVLVKRCFAAVAAQDGKAACSMIMSGFAKLVPQEYGQGSAPYARGKTCAVVMSKTFAHYHRQLAPHAASLQIAGVRVDGSRGLAVLAFKALPAREIRVVHEGRVWRISALLGAEFP
jgi:hypothetical protein